MMCVAGIGADVELIFWRAIMGFGIGGDYPLSATIVAEYSSTKWRGSFIASVFAMQVSCQPVPPFILLVQWNSGNIWCVCAAM